MRETINHGGGFSAPTVILTPFRARARLPRTGDHARPRPMRLRTDSQAGEGDLGPHGRSYIISRPPRQGTGSTLIMQTSPAPEEVGLGGRLDLSRIAQDLQIRKVQVEAVVQLLDEGNTIPFITRYRKERTGGLDEEVLRIIQERIGQLRQLADRKQTVLRSIDNQGKLTPELRDAILAADNPKRLEDLYLPYKPKKRTLSTAARDKGLEPFALAIWNSDPVALNLAEVLPTMLNPEKGLNTPEDVLLGAQHILAEMIAESA